jgi:hypothetical protein
VFSRVFTLVVCLGLTAPGAAWADGSDPTDKRVPDSAEKKAARILADEGLALFNRGDYQAALGKFEQAEKLVPALTIRIEIARSLDKLGRLLEARERYEAIVAEELPKLSPFVVKKAQDDAGAELEALKARIPTLSLQIEGPRSDGIALFIDGKPQELASFEGVERAIDPGAKTIELRRRDVTTAKKIAIADGEHAKLRIVLPPIVLPKEALAERSAREKLMKGIGWGGFALAGAGTLVAIGTGAAAVSTKADLTKKCAGSKCGPAQWDEVSRYDRLRATTTTALILGAIGGAVGTTMFLLAPRTNEHPTVQAGVGPAWLSLTVEL